MFPILDIYDAIQVLPHDDSGEVSQGLKKIASAIGSLTIPESREEYTSLNDSCFALIFDRAGVTERRYPVHTKEAAALSLTEFNVFWKNLEPENLVKVAGANIVNACERFGIAIPAEVVVFGTYPVSGNEASGIPSVRMEKVAEEASDPSNDYALQVNGVWKYPIKTAEHVTKACDFFEKRFKEFSPDQRHPYAVKVAEKAKQFGVPITETVKAYSVHQYSPFHKLAIISRFANARNNDHKQALADIMTKEAELDPEQYALELNLIDATYGHTKLYGKSFPDPWTAVYYGATEATKTASEDTKLLHKMSKIAASGKMRTVFGDGMLKLFVDDPASIINSLTVADRAVIDTLAR